MSIKKHFDGKKPICKVTFTVDKDIANSANRINLAGDFNHWDIESIPMKKLKGGEYSVSVDLKNGKEYEFKYIINGNDWLNDIEADKFVPNVFHSENSVVNLGK